jgi:hypothetical protein
MDINEKVHLHTILSIMLLHSYNNKTMKELNCMTKINSVTLHTFCLRFKHRENLFIYQVNNAVKKCTKELFAQRKRNSPLVSILMEMWKTR